MVLENGKEDVMQDRQGRSLTLIVTLYCAAVIAAGMGVYAGFQYFLGREHTVIGLIVQHGWHVLVLGVLIYLALYVVLLRKIVRPLQSLFLKLYAIAGGDLRPASIESNILEIQGIADGINLMLARIGRSAPGVSLSELANVASELRSLARSYSVPQTTKDALLKIAADIEGAAASLMKDSLQGKQRA